MQNLLCYFLNNSCIGKYHSFLILFVRHELEARASEGNIMEVYLEVAHQNESAYYLYKKNGFREVEHQNDKEEISKVIVMKYTV